MPVDRTMKYIDKLRSAGVRLKGADVYRYLQTKCTRDTRRWEPGVATWGFLVDINGKLIADVEFVPLDDETVDLWVHEAYRKAVAAHLEKYVILEDVDVSELPESSAVVHGAVESPSVAGLDAYAVACPALPDGWQRVYPTSSALGAVVEEVERRALEWEHSLPRPGDELAAGEMIPLEAGLLAGIDFNKGCYLGQEVIERLYSRGSPSRRLARVTFAFSGDDVQELRGAKLVANDKNAGTVARPLSVDGGTVRAFAWVRRKYLGGDAELTVEPTGQKVSIVDLAGTLEP